MREREREEDVLIKRVFYSSQNVEEGGVGWIKFEIKERVGR
jgi:hypothetical protein